jgi:hypothetical protein
VRFFLSHRGGPLGYRGVHQTFVTLTTALGLRTATVHPRIHEYADVAVMPTFGSGALRIGLIAA